MLEGLETVQWSKLHHAYGTAEDVPDMLRAMLSDNEEQRQQAYDDFGGSVHHQGDIYDSTVEIIPFVREMLNNPLTPNRGYFAGFLLSVLESTVLYSSDNEMFPHEVRLQFQAYEQIENGFTDYLDLLSHDESVVRDTVLQLLYHLPDKADDIIAELWRIVKTEPNILVQARMIVVIGHLASKSALTFEEATDAVGYFRLFQEYVENSRYDPQIRLAACRAIISVSTARHWRRDALGVPAFVFPALLDLLEHSHGDDASRYRSTWHYNLRVTRLSVLEALFELAKKQGVQPLIGLLSLPHITPDEAHLIGREMMDIAFNRVRLVDARGSWELYRHEGKKFHYESQPYGVKGDTPLLAPMSSRGKIQHQVLEALVNCDKFWHYPTNLFEFFYGLPNSRRELKRLLGNQATAATVKAW